MRFIRMTIGYIQLIDFPRKNDLHKLWPVTEIENFVNKRAQDHWFVILPSNLQYITSRQYDYFIQDDDAFHHHCDISSNCTWQQKIDRQLRKPHVHYIYYIFRVDRWWWWLIWALRRITYINFRESQMTRSYTSITIPATHTHTTLRDVKILTMQTFKPVAQFIIVVDATTYKTILSSLRIYRYVVWREDLCKGNLFISLNITQAINAYIFKYTIYNLENLYIIWLDG